MSPLLEKKLRFSDVVYAIDTTPKVVRNWLARKQVKLSFRHDAGWREFSVMDVAALALVRRLVDFGMTVEEASDFANSVLILTTEQMLRFKKTPPMALASHYTGKLLVAWRADGEWYIRLDENEMKAPPSDAFAVVLLQPVLERALRRAVAGTKDGEGEDNSELAAQIHKAAIVMQDMTDSLKGEHESE